MIKYYVYKYVVDNEIIYIGLTNDISRRIAEHASGEGLEEKFLPYLSECEIYYHECGNDVEMRSLEKLLINMYKPKLNIIDMQYGACTVSLQMDWILFSGFNSNEYYAIMKELTQCQKQIQSNETRISAYQEKQQLLYDKVKKLTPFYLWLEKHKTDMARLHNEYFGMDDNIVPRDTAVYMGTESIEHWAENKEYESGICWVQFSAEFLQRFFAISSYDGWVDKTLDAIGLNRIADIDKRIENLKRKNRELEAQKESLVVKLSSIDRA